jgi:hypothetical protein
MLEVSIILDYFSVCAKREKKENFYLREDKSHITVIMTVQGVACSIAFMFITFTSSIIIIIIIIIITIIFPLFFHTL